MSAAPAGSGRTPRRTLQRRQTVLVALAGAAFITLVTALAASRAALWGVQVIADALLLGYVARLIHFRNVAADRAMNLRSLVVGRQRFQ